MESQDGFPTPNCSSSRIIHRSSPLPQLSWGDPNEIWESMIIKDEIYSRDLHMLAKHPNVTPRMRSILLDWLSEVSELFNLHRETYYFALDFVDRYLSNQRDIPRQQLQLIGITCLFIAAKIEEVYPPKVTDFAFVTDGACSADEIINKELVIMESLKWSLHPVTVNKWLSVFMQLYSILERENNRDPDARSTGDNFLIPNYSSTFFAQIAHLIDLSMLDIGSLQFFYDVIAASAFYHFTNEETVYECTRFKLSDIRECVMWMTPFALAIRETGFEEPKAKNVNGSWSTMQYHTADLTLLEKAHMKQLDLQEESGSDSSSMPPSPVSTPNTSQVKSTHKRKRETSPMSDASANSNKKVGTAKRKRDINNNDKSSKKRKSLSPPTSSPSAS